MPTDQGHYVFEPGRCAAFRKRTWRLLRQAFALSALACAFVASAAIPIEDFARRELPPLAKLSPDGKYLALTWPFSDELGLIVLRIADHAITAKIAVGAHRGVADFWWASSERIVLTLFEEFGSLSQPASTGELLAINADGSERKYLFGIRGDQDFLFSRKKVETFVLGYAWMIDPLPYDPHHILVSAVIAGERGKFGDLKLFRLDIDTGSREQIGEAPTPGKAILLTDDNGAIRYASVFNDKGLVSAYTRPTNEAPWQPLDSHADDASETAPIALSGDGNLLLQRAAEGGHECLVSQDLTTGHRTTLRCNDLADIGRVIFSFDGKVPIATLFEIDRPRILPLDIKHSDLTKLEALARSFPNDVVLPLSSTLDGSKVVVYVHSDRNPGDYYLFDTHTNKAAYLLSRMERINPEDMAERQPVHFKARDGTELHGYLTMPRGYRKETLPLVVNPHGGPFHIADQWYWDSDAQLLASRGYAVLQVNFRGSGGRGVDFVEAARARWDTTMIDDITDGARWAIAEGITAPGRLCIYGASFGGYAAVMSAIREPSLYRCAVAYAGVYDLKLWRGDYDHAKAYLGKKYVREYVGDTPEALERASPINRLDTLKAALMIVHGTDDARAPFSQAQALMEALDARRYPYEQLIRLHEGHGFYTEKNRREFYTRLLSFLDRQIGAENSDASAAAP